MFLTICHCYILGILTDILLFLAIFTFHRNYYDYVVEKLRYTTQVLEILADFTDNMLEKVHN